MLRRPTRNPEALGAGIALALLVAASLACVSGEDSGAADSFGEINAVIEGTITTSGGAPLQGARVATDRGDFSTTTDATGSYKLNVAGEKTYNVYSTSQGYKTVVSKGVRVLAGDRKTVDLRFTTLLAAGERTYVGSSQCKLCHSTQHTRWANAPHRVGLSAPGDSPGVLAGIETLFSNDFDLATTSNFSAYGANAPRLSRDGDTRLVTIGNVAYPVTYALGYQWKQRFLTRIGDAHYTLPIQYNVATGEWVTYNATDWYNGTTPRFTSQTSIETDVYKKNSWERKCMGCHSVTGILSFSFSASTTSGVQQHEADWVEKGIGCEACHGPGSAHVWGNGAIGDAANPNVINPSKLVAGRQMDVCGQCHSRGVGVATLGGQAGDTYTLEYYYSSSHGFPAFNGTASTFRPGDTLVVGYTDGGGYWTDSYAEVRTSKQHHQQWNDIYQSAHTAPNAADTVTCGSCHDNHGPVGYARQLRLSADDNSLCLTCHGPDGNANQRFSTGAAVLAHTGPEEHSDETYDPGGTGMGRCVTCHMPFTAKTALNHDIRSHTFRVVRPHNTRRFYNASASETMPNSCQQACHYSGASLGPDFGSGTAGALAAAEAYDTTVEHPAEVRADTPSFVVRGRITVQGADSFDDTFGVWVTADFTNYSAVTDREGRYALRLDAPGTYTIRAMKAGYDSATDTAMTTATTDSFGVLNLTIAAGGGAGSFSQRPYRCNACHGANWGAEWRRSGFEGQMSEAEGEVDLAAGHGRMVSSPAGGCGTRCHEARGAALYLAATTNETAVSPTVTGAGSRRATACQVCHRPHDSSWTGEDSSLQKYRTTAFETGYFFGRNTSTTDSNGVTAAQATDSSMAYPPSYEAASCFYCHNARTAPRWNGAGVEQSGSIFRPRTGIAHVGNNADGFFGRIGLNSVASYNFDTPTGFLPRNSTHSETNWGQVYAYQEFVYENGSPRLLYRDGVPLARQNERFTCLTCHMHRNEDGTHGSGTSAAIDGGHTWKPDIRTCGLCHDPSYISLNPYTNNLKSGLGDVGTWGTGSWGVNSSGTVLGFDRPVSALPHQRDNGNQNANGGPDGVSNDYDGNGVAEGAHTEVKNLLFRVMASMVNGGETHGVTSGIGVSGRENFGDTFTASGSSRYWQFNAARGAAGQISNDEARIAWNLVVFEHDETNLGVHNLRFAVETLRAMWTSAGRRITGNSAWTPPGDDY